MDDTQTLTEEQKIDSLAEKYAAADEATAKAAREAALQEDIDANNETLRSDDELDAEDHVVNSDPGEGAESEEELARSESREARAKGDEDEDDDELGDEFKEAAERAGIPTSLDDIPEAARPLVRTRLKEIESGFTRAMQDARSYRQDERAFRAEESYRKTHPAEFIASMLQEDPELEEKVAAEVEKRRNPDLAEARKIVDQKHRDDALRAILEEDQAAEARAERGAAVEQLARKTCVKEGIPFGKTVERAVVGALLAKRQEDPDADLTDAEIVEVVKELAVEHHRSARAHRREERKGYVRGKVEDSKRAGIRPGSGNPPPPTGNKPKPKTLEEKMDETAARLFPGAP